MLKRLRRFRHVFRFVVLEHVTRRMPHATSQWPLQQPREAIPVGGYILTIDWSRKPLASRLP
jgi:hypothetical protein